MRNLISAWLCWFFLAAPVTALENRLAIIIDDLGYRYNDRQALSLDGDFTLSILPHTPYAVSLADSAYTDGKEVMLHLPMEASDGNRLGPAALTSAMDQPAFKQVIHQALSAFPHVRGVNNHMGSRLTSLEQPMRWTMQVLKQYPVYFVDSRTTIHTRAEQAANNFGVPALRRHVFLDTRATESFVSGQIERLIRLAKQGKRPVAIGHPYPETLLQLQGLLARLEQEGLQLVPVSALLTVEQQSALAPMAESRIRALH